MTDVCLDEYTSHGHCGVIRDGEVDNDATLPLLARAAVSHARAGADVVAPSDMMDGRVAAIRRELDGAGLLRTSRSWRTPPRRRRRSTVRSARPRTRRRSSATAAATRWTAPTGARRCARSRSTSRRARTPSWSSRRSRTSTSSARRASASTLPIAAYNVSGEYAMVKAAAANGWIDERRIVLEILTSIVRAGADFVLTYHAADAARWLARRRLGSGWRRRRNGPKPEGRVPELRPRLFRRASGLMPGGVSSPVRSFASVGGEPFFVASARGARVRDADGRSYIDFVDVLRARTSSATAPPSCAGRSSRAARRGTSFGAPTELEVRLAERVVEAGAVDRDGALRQLGHRGDDERRRAWRGRATGRKRIVKVEGGYHGHGDSFLVSAGSGVATLGIAGSPGVPEELAALTTVVPYNDAAGARGRRSARFPGEIAAVDPRAGRGEHGARPSEAGLPRGRPPSSTTEHGALLVFDEVITGFRVAPGGAQELYGVRPDLTTLGKILGGGLPIGAYGGRRDLMERMAPSGPVYQAGTLSGNPLAMSAGIAMLDEIRRRPPYAALEAAGALLESLLRAEIASRGLSDRALHDARRARS